MLYTNTDSMLRSLDGYTLYTILYYTILYYTILYYTVYYLFIYAGVLQGDMLSQLLFIITIDYVLYIEFVYKHPLIQFKNSV